MVCTELLLNFVPQVIVLVLYQVNILTFSYVIRYKIYNAVNAVQSTGILLSTYVGPHNLFLSSLDALISALTFQWIFKKRLQLDHQQQQQNHETPVHYLAHHAFGHPPHPQQQQQPQSPHHAQQQQQLTAVRTSTLLVDHSINM
jgi:hypothetical protein